MSLPEDESTRGQSPTTGTERASTSHDRTGALVVAFLVVVLVGLVIAAVVLATAVIRNVDLSSWQSDNVPVATASLTGESNDAGLGEVAWDPHAHIELVAGVDIEPGTYRSVTEVLATDGPGYCYWDINDGPTADDPYVTSGFIAGGYALVVLADYQLLTTYGCPEWVKVDEATLLLERDAAATDISEGMWLVGEDIQPGTYRMLGAGPVEVGGVCSYVASDPWDTSEESYYEWGFTDSDDVLTMQVTLGTLFATTGCGDWERIGD